MYAKTVGAIFLTMAVLLIPNSFSARASPPAYSLLTAKTSTDVLVFNNFEHGNSTNGGGACGPMSYDGRHDPSVRFVGNGVRGKALCLSFPHTVSPDRWGGYYMFSNPWKSLDVSGYKYLRFWAQGGRVWYTGNREHFHWIEGLQLKVEMADAKYLKSVYITVPLHWQQFTIPLSAFYGLDLKHIKQINLVMNFSPPEVPPSGRLLFDAWFVDEIEFVKELSIPELLFNDFERWCYSYQARRWLPGPTNFSGTIGPMSPNGEYNPVPTRQQASSGNIYDRIFTSDYCLRLSYDFPADNWCGLWMFANDDNPDDGIRETMDASMYTDIRMLVRNAPYTPAGPEPPPPSPPTPPPSDAMKVELKDALGGTHAVYLYMCRGFEYEVPENWTEAVIPLSTFTGVDLTRLRQVNLVFDLPGGQGSPHGAVDVDDIRFTTLSPQAERYDGIVIDYFNDGAAPNELGGNCGVAKPDNTVSIREFYCQESYEGLGALRLDYDARSKWVAYWTFMNESSTEGVNLEAAGMKSIELYAKGYRGSEKFYVELRDTENNSHKVPITKVPGFENGLTQTYRNIAIPLQVFSKKGVDLANVQQVAIVVDGALRPNAGRIFIDLLRFTDSSAPLLLNEPPVAWINSIWPNPAKEGQEITFEGSGADPDGTVVEYEWRSSIDGVFAAGQFTVPVRITRNNLSPGTHTISFRVRDDRGEWSQPATATLTIGGTARPGWFVDDDNDVDLDDLMIVAYHYGKEYTDPGWFPQADVDSDGDVDLDDLMIVAYHYGETWRG